MNNGYQVPERSDGEFIRRQQQAQIDDIGDYLEALRRHCYALEDELTFPRDFSVPWLTDLEAAYELACREADKTASEFEELRALYIKRYGDDP